MGYAYLLCVGYSTNWNTYTLYLILIYDLNVFYNHKIRYLLFNSKYVFLPVPNPKYLMHTMGWTFPLKYIILGIILLRSNARWNDKKIELKSLQSSVVLTFYGINTNTLYYIVVIIVTGIIYNKNVKHTADDVENIWRAIILWPIQLSETIFCHRLGALAGIIDSIFSPLFVTAVAARVPI